MAKYFNSLRRVIDLKPRVIFPSHGTALGGTYRLEETLKHREQREAQVLSHLQAGTSIDDMLGQMYAGTPPFLLPLARVNIESHIAKLRAEATAPATRA